METTFRFPIEHTDTIKLVDNSSEKFEISIGLDYDFSDDEIDFLEQFGVVSFSDRDKTIIYSETGTEFPRKLIEFLEGKVENVYNEIKRVQTSDYDEIISQTIRELKQQSNIDNWYGFLEFLLTKVKPALNQEFLKQLYDIEKEMY